MTIDGCGMGFDFLRSTHTLTAIVDDKGTVEKKVRWLFCKPGAKPFPGWSWAGNPAWEPEPDEWGRGPGIRLHPLKYSNNKVNVPPGQEYHGPLEWFENGVPTQEIENARLRPGEHQCPWPDVVEMNARGWPGERPREVITITAYGWNTEGPMPPPTTDEITAYGWPSSVEAIVHDGSTDGVEAYGWPSSVEAIVHDGSTDGVEAYGSPTEEEGDAGP